jgi:membrane protein required for colicin V production
MPFDWFDVLLALIILMSVVAGLKSGFARVIVGLIATIAGVLVGFWCYRIAGAKLTPYVSTTALADMLGFLIIFFGIVIMGALLAALLANLFRWIGLSWFDHFLGGIAGFVRGILIVAGVAAVLVAFVPSPVPAFVTNSRILPYASHVAAALAEAAPRDLKDSFFQEWQNLKQFWARQRMKQTQG